ncbi:hypothetical protein G5C51_04235 [Streptomyces sp. A7024]|uniref:Glycerophosphoryl diester phosphodiesterase n=1 Tax=Streptomyces coryli TaxID=1128680 RepID=A0A6G4TT02_9ACTN|nr:hypothetical protein [Streptomyces coryli]NGN63115.1 hypothetical protein [Streptomyces coryli]
MPTRRTFVKASAATALAASADRTGTAQAAPAGPVRLAGERVRIDWRHTPDGWQASRAAARDGRDWRELPGPRGSYGITHAPDPAKPDPKQVQADQAGTHYDFWPEDVTSDGDGLTFRHTLPCGSLSAHWRPDPDHPTDIRVTLTWTAAQDGWVSLRTPTLCAIPESRLAWGTVPGLWYGHESNADLRMAAEYGHGLPAVPQLGYDHLATTLAPLISTDDGLTLAAIAEPGMGRDPYAKDAITHRENRLALSTRDRAGHLAPHLARPVLGGAGSWTKAGEERVLDFRFSLAAADWFDVYRHAIEDVYGFSRYLDLARNEHALTDRLARIQGTYIADPALSQWLTDDYEGTEIGAQKYNGFVQGADKDAMKNSDIGAMWGLAAATGDPLLERDRLPYVRAFKLAQQQTATGHYQGDLKGQYYLYKSNRFVEEGNPDADIPDYVEPLATTYYVITDLAHILLFEPGDAEIEGRIRLAADKLASVQKRDGSWEVATNKEPPYAVTYPHLTEDLRPTWYGLFVAHRVLGDERYLTAARRGADWYVKHAVQRARYLGSTGDSGFRMDLSLSQGIQGLLDLAEATGERRYRKAALEVARIHTTWVYTHPRPSAEPRTRDGETYQAWQLTQLGLQKEQNDSAPANGPILLSSFAGTYLRVFRLTGEPLYRDMARAAALGRDAFTAEAPGVHSYYWQTFDKGIGAFPHHSWWQIGWILDYLLEEARTRSGGRVTFPRGYFTPKVGGQQTYGFAPGTVHGTKATLRIPPRMLTADTPQAEVLGALAVDGERLFALVLNSAGEPLTATVTADPAKLHPEGPRQITGIHAVSGRLTGADAPRFTVALPPYGMAVVRLDLQS